MLKRLSPLFALLLLAACAAPLQSVLLHQPAAQATADAALAVAAVAQPPAISAAPATLETALIVSLWDEASGTQAILPVDPATGAALEGYAPLVLGQGFSSARSPDGRFLAALNYEDQACDAWAGGTRCQPHDGLLHFIDLAAWRDTATAVRADSNATFLRYSPSGGALAIGQSLWPEHSVLLVDTASGALVDRAALSFYPSEAAFSADGQHLYVYGQHYSESNGFNPEARAALLSTTDMRVLWQPALPGVRDGQYVAPDAKNVHDESVWWQPGVVFAPEAGRLYVVHADTKTLTAVDFAAQTVRDLPIGPAQSWLDRLMALTAGVAEAKILNGSEARAVLAGSGDEQRLYVVGAHTETRGGAYTRTPLGLQVIDPATGVELARRETAASQIAPAPDGQRLLLTQWEPDWQVQVVDRDSLAAVTELAEQELYFTQLVGGQRAAFAMNVTPSETAVRWLDPATFDELAQWTASKWLWLVP